MGERVANDTNGNAEGRGSYFLDNRQTRIQSLVLMPLVVTGLGVIGSFNGTFGRLRLFGGDPQ